MMLSVSRGIRIDAGRMRESRDCRKTRSKALSAGDSAEGRQFGRAGAVNRCAGPGHVVQLPSFGGPAQQQAPATPVAATDEIDREPQTSPEYLQQDIDIF